MGKLYDRMKGTLLDMVKNGAERQNANPEFAKEDLAGGNIQVPEAQIYSRKIGKKEILEANQILMKYKRGKVNLENKIVANEEWWKMRHWSRGEEKEKDSAASGWLFNCIISKHADAMDAYPEPNFLPREPGDEEQARILSEIVPVILGQNKMRNTYSDVMWYKLIQGTGAYGVFWDGSKLNGLGDISVKKIDLLNLYWDMSQKSIQDSENVFLIKLESDKNLERTYPQLKGKLGSKTQKVTKYLYEDFMDTSDKSVVVDWYYKVQVDGKTIVHYVKFAGNEVLRATENEQGMEQGLYAHGKYPFILDPLFPISDLAVGFGYVDVCRRPQEYIDSLNAAIQKNALMGSTPRYFTNGASGVNEEEFADWTKPFVHTNGNLGEDALRQIDVKQLDGIYVTVLNNKIEELKETSGNRDVNNGGSASGVTAASAIAAMQEQSGKTSRDSTESSYVAYEEVMELIVELIRQFYTTERQFRIIGTDGKKEFVKFSNAGIAEQEVVSFSGETMYRKPVFDIEISAQKASPYSKLSQNEFALQLYNQGFFNPEMADQALACLDVMDFNHKEDVVNKVQENGTMYQKMMQMQSQMQQMAEIIDSLQGSSLSGKFNPQLGQRMPQGRPAELESGKENAIVENAREAAQQATQPR